MFHKTINLIKLNYKLKNTHLKLKVLNKNDFKIIKIFMKFNIIKYVKKEDNFYCIYYSYIKNNVVFSSIKNIFKPSKLHFISLKELIKINRKSTNIIILSTNKGLITNFEAEKLKIGGIIIIILKI